MRRPTVRTGALALALLVCGCGDSADEVGAPIAAPAPAIPPPSGSEWIRTVVETAEGGFQMGNPEAPVKLVEYGSMTCSHCATFSRQATAPLTQLVKSGHLSWEFRPYLLFPTDPAVTLLARCHGANEFFGVMERIYASQSDWTDKASDLSSAEMQRIRTLPPAQQVSAMVKGAGLDGFVGQRSDLASCVADERQLKRLVAQTNVAKREGVRGTPTFFINGKIIRGASRWETLRPELQSALGS